MDLFSPVSPGFGELFAIMAGIIIIGIAVSVVRSMTKAVVNLGEPVIARNARVVSRREDTYVRGGMDNMRASSSTDYFITFEFDDGNRAEFGVEDHEFAILAEGDVGVLSSRGTWFEGFERHAATS